MNDEPVVPPPTKKPAGVKIRPNDPCWCQGGRKYKRCHYSSDVYMSAEEKAVLGKREALREDANGFKRRAAGLTIAATMGLFAAHEIEG